MWTKIMDERNENIRGTRNKNNKWEGKWEQWMRVMDENCQRKSTDKIVNKKRKFTILLKNEYDIYIEISKYELCHIQ